jgi:hypothetical protein
MPTVPFTIIDEQRPFEVWAEVDAGRVWLSPESLEAALGWRVEPRGLCRGDVCVPVSDAGRVLAEAGVELAPLAALLDRPLALDPEEGVAALAAPAAERATRLARLEAPDFALPDLEGRDHRLSDHRGRKVLLIAYASW